MSKQETNTRIWDPLSDFSDGSHDDQHSDKDDKKNVKEFSASISADDVFPEKFSRLGFVAKKKIFPSTDLLKDCDIDPGLTRLKNSDSENFDFSADSDKTPDSNTTSDLMNSSVFDDDLDWNIESPSPSVTPVNEEVPAGEDGDAQKELEENQRWRTIQIGDKQYRIDLKVIEPYKRILSHGGYVGDGFNTIIVLTACYLPDKRRRDYHYVMRNLFLYVISTLELLVLDEYTIIYFHGAVPRQKMPSFRWLRQSYEMIDRKFKKNLKSLLIVHPTFFLRTVMLMSKPFISSKFYVKLKYVRGLEELGQIIPMNHVYIPEEIKKYEGERIQRHSSTKSR